MYKLFSCMLTKVDHYKLSSCMQHHLLSCLNFENVKEWFCVSPFTTSWDLLTYFLAALEIKLQDMI